jgi:hypothetical protein
LSGSQGSRGRQTWDLKYTDDLKYNDDDDDDDKQYDSGHRSSKSPEVGLQSHHSSHSLPVFPGPVLPVDIQLLCSIELDSEQL